MSSTYDFPSDNGPVMSNDLQDYTFRFIWCCHAVRWAIAEYDRRSGFPHKLVRE